ncbi:MAG TPA: hypothetical protein PLZ74_02015, partial [Kiritimatiellia bacterium]|nr:hypothetical protein [Kiritimatiellia bacterium]
MAAPPKAAAASATVAKPPASPSRVECRGSRGDDPDPDPDLDETLKHMKLHENQEFPLAFQK